VDCTVSIQRVYGGWAERSARGRGSTAAKFRFWSPRGRDLPDAGIAVDDHFADADGELLEIVRVGMNLEPAVVFFSGTAARVGVEAGELGPQGFVAFAESDPNSVHLGLVLAVAEHEEQFLAGIDREHPEERADLHLDREQVVQNEIKRYLAVHFLKIRNIRKCSRGAQSQAEKGLLSNGRIFQHKVGGCGCLLS
jgi:hypothetical protein